MLESHHPNAVARAYHHDAVTRFELQGLSISVEHHLASWCAAVRRTERQTYLTPSFNPDHVDLGESEFLGGLLYRGTEIVACSAVRLVVTDDLVRDELTTMRIWQNNPCPEERLEHLGKAKDLPTIRGRTCHEGCTWVSPAHRRRGIAARFVNMMRALALDRWKPQWIFGFLMPDTHRSGIGYNTYGYRRSAPLELGYMPIVRRNVSAFLSYMSSREAALIMTSREKPRLEPRTPKP